jgi:metallo-beta-lactamase family protein
MKLTFLGAAGTVTGSKYLLETSKQKLMIDCGLFQGLKALRLRNWAPFPIDPASVDALILTHAHLDHSGYLPLLAKLGFKGAIHCSQATRDLCCILLLDSAHIQEKDAEFHNKHNTSKHEPALPLYTVADVMAVMKQFKTHPFKEPFALGEGVQALFRHAGHILGAASLELQADDKTIVFSGDLGRPNDPVMWPPAPVPAADYLLIESTYGNRVHDSADTEERLAEIITRTAQRGGKVVIPSFAVGRSQSLLYILAKLKAAHRIPNLPIYLDSPMAIEASEMIHRFPHDHRLSPEQCKAMDHVATYTTSVDESKAIASYHGPMVILSASGMATGGRILHHLMQYLSDRRNTVVLAGFQAEGTRGRSLQEGQKFIKIFGKQIEVHAQIETIHALSAHADSNEILDWLKHFETAPKQVFVTHGEDDAAAALAERIHRELGWECMVPQHGEVVDLEGY